MPMKVAVFEDDVFKQTFFTQALAAIPNYDWIVARNGQELANLASRPLAALLIDIDNDSGAKLNFVKQAASFGFGGVPIIIMSSRLRPQQIDSTVLANLGAAAFVSWPTHAAALIEKIDYVVSLRKKPEPPPVPDLSLKKDGASIDAGRPKEPTKPALREKVITILNKDILKPVKLDEKDKPANIQPEFKQALGQPPLTVGELEAMGRERFLKIMELYDKIDGMDYFEVIGVGKDDPTNQIKAVYYKLARVYHPDRFGKVTQPEMRRRVYDVFKRMTEAYQVLSDEDRRKKYLRSIQEKRELETLRMREPMVKQAPQQASAYKIRSANARKFFDLGDKAKSEGNLKSALMNYKLALQQAPTDENIKAAIEEVERGLKAQKK